MTLSQFNQLPFNEANECLMQCCTSHRWVARMLERRPFASIEALQHAADQAWLGLTEPDYLEAFEGHPKIGDLNSLRAKYANTKALAGGEQRSVNDAPAQVIEALSQGNALYLKRFGFIFIVCASGKSAPQMLLLLEQRLHNDRATELQIAAEQQRQIFQLRLEKLL